jgi:hypothetical protein
MNIEEAHVQLTVRIPRSLSAKFRELVNMKHPTYKLGSLSYEIEQAMRQYIASYTVITHAQSTNTNTKQSLHVEKAKS